MKTNFESSHNECLQSAKTKSGQLGVQHGGNLHRRTRKALAGPTTHAIADGAGILLYSSTFFPVTWGLKNRARHVIDCHLSQVTRIKNEFDDVATAIHQFDDVIGCPLSRESRVRDGFDDVASIIHQFDDVASNVHQPLP